MKKIVAQFIPILLLLLFLSQFTEFVRFSHTTLGKLVAVLIIIFYTFLDKVFGLFTCALVILFYQTDYIEGMLNTDDLHLQNDIGDGLPILINESTETESKKKFPKGISAEKMADYATVYEKPSNLDLFRRENCVEGQLTYKGMKVRKDMAEHVFPQLIVGDNKCDPCKSGCQVGVR
jgi:hypothetical protein